MRAAGPWKNAPSSGKAFPNLPRGIESKPRWAGEELWCRKGGTGSELRA